jgi:hypothetical protein
MSCLNNCNCECIQIDNINQCDQVVSFDLGILNAERDLKFNITGRSKRIYQIDVTTEMFWNSGNLGIAELPE